MTDEYAGWSAKPISEGFSDDPLPALEAFIARLKERKPIPRGRPILLHYDEFVKATNGEPFSYMGSMWKLIDGVPTPV